MKKLLLLILAISLCFSIAGCTTPKTEVSQTGTELTSSNTLIIEGDKYVLPAPTQTFVNNGWSSKPEGTLSEAINAESGGYYFMSLWKNNEEKISRVGFYNHKDTNSTLSESSIFCVQLIGLSKEAGETTCSFTLPGGITEKSTYEDVLAKYGTHENSYTDSQHYVVTDEYETAQKSEHFEKYGFNVTFRSKNAEAAPYNYTFTFNADKTINKVDVESANYKAAALTAFD